jgi:hypothetical protein
MNEFFKKVVGVLKRGFDFGQALVRYAGKLRPFVLTTAAELESLIPDSGMGNIKLLAFDQALKVFVAASSDFEEQDVQEGDTVWTVAHWLLEVYLAAQKARAAVRVTAPAGA